MSDPPRWRRVQLWPGAVYWVCYGLLGVILAYVVVLRWLRPVFLAEPIQVVAGPGLQVDPRLNPNVARQSELERLPRIGPALAGRIVAYRQQRLTTMPAGQAVFRTPEDLQAVRGIGPKTVEQLRPFLKFSDQDNGGDQTKALEAAASSQPGSGQ
jgi:hypothetical protein